jgi:hypothetical protein
MTTRTLIVSPSIIFQQITVPWPTYLVLLGVQVRTRIGAANMNTPMWPPSLVVHKTFFHLKFTVMLSTERLSDLTGHTSSVDLQTRSYQPIIKKIWTFSMGWNRLVPRASCCAALCLTPHVRPALCRASRSCLAPRAVHATRASRCAPPHPRINESSLGGNM